MMNIEFLYWHTFASNYDDQTLGDLYLVPSAVILILPVRLSVLMFELWWILSFFTGILFHLPFRDSKVKKCWLCACHASLCKVTKYNCNFFVTSLLYGVSGHLHSLTTLPSVKKGTKYPLNKWLGIPNIMSGLWIIVYNISNS